MLRDTANDRVFLTIDTWASQAHHAAFLEAYGHDYRLLDEDCGALTEFETYVGSYRASNAL